MSSTLFLQLPSCTTILSSINPTTNKKSINNPQIPLLTTNKNTESDSISQANVIIKAPTAPWMKHPLHLQSHELLDLSKPRKNNTSKKAKIDKTDKALTAKESGVRGKKAVKKIVKNIERLRRCGDSVYPNDNSYWFELGDSFERLGGDGDFGFRKRMPWMRDERIVFKRMKKERVITKAELNLDKELLMKLRAEAAKMRKWVKVMKLGVTQNVVDEIRLVWGSSELALIKFGVPLSRNMNRAREIVEMKTGGLVVWTRKDTLVVYRGCNYQWTKNSDVSIMDENFGRKDGEEESFPTSIIEEGDVDIQPINRSLFERETDRLLDGLGPRFVDWWMRKPLPVDADLLPEVVDGFRTPSRLCPPNARSKLRDDELTYLRKLAKALPTHFVLGRNRKLQGLAVAILKLWEKSLIAKVSVKWGVPNTDNEQMANELKHLTGGVLLLRNKYIIILYRGKDFVPYQVATLIADREVGLKRCQLNEEGARMKAIETLCMTEERLINTSKVGTLYEFQYIKSKFGELAKENRELDLQLEAERAVLERDLRNHELKLNILKSKIEKSASKLSKLNAKEAPAEQDPDQEMMTEEEKQCFRKIGLKMHGSLVLGRRGVFDGVIEGLHQHWKHKEVVKVITMQRLFAQVMYSAKFLEAESGGILVSVDKLKEGHAIILYRGKNYKRPLKMDTSHLLARRDALCRSLLMQRIGSLKFFAYQRQCAIAELKDRVAEVLGSVEKSLKNSQTMS